MVCAGRHQVSSCPPDAQRGNLSAGRRRAENFSIGSARGGMRHRFTNKEKAELAEALAASTMAPCPLCQGAHQFSRSFSSGAFFVPWPPHRLETCPEFIKLTSSQRATTNKSLVLESPHGGLHG